MKKPRKKREITDRERLDWLEKNFKGDNKIEFHWSVTECFKVYPENNYMEYETSLTLRQAIDAEIKKARRKA